MSKDHKQEYQNIFVNIAMHGWFDERNITQEKKKKSFTPTAANMDKSRYHLSKNHLNFYVG